ncbi:MAG: PAQR family membrane homeostasis protein TrhA [Chloroflexota bacterium]
MPQDKRYSIEVNRRRFTFGEEVANSVSHGAMAAIVLLALPVGAVTSYLRGGVLESASVSVFIISLYLMFQSSTLYHAMAPDSVHKAVFRILDHIFIYVAIAGSYTPVALCVIGGWQGVLIVVIQWMMVLFGILYKSLSRRSLPKVSLTIYLVMGWTVILFLPTFLSHANPVLLTLIATGGVLYSGGVFFYALKGFKYHHMVWHLFVNLGALSHFVAIVFFLK